MKRGSVFVILLFVALIATATTSLAANMNFNFALVPNGPSDNSAATVKNASNWENKWYVTPKSSLNGTSSWWENGETVRWRARTESWGVASALYSRTRPNYGTTFNYPYSITAAGNKKYCLFADCVNVNTSFIRVVGTWCP